MRIYTLGKVGGLFSTTLFHAFARLNLFGLILVEPEDTYLSLGYLDNAMEILDMERIKSLGVPVIRREVGGGTVLLAPGQVFYQLIVPKSLVPFKVEDAYRKFSQPVLETYKRLGIEVEYRPINDILVKKNQRKISGQGAGDIEKAFVFVGNILLKFDVGLMAELLKVPDKDCLRETMGQNLTWLEKELGRSFKFSDVAKLLEEGFKRILPLESKGSVPEDAIRLAKKLREELTSEDNLFEDTGRKHRLVKIREGVLFRNRSMDVGGTRVSLVMIVENQKIKLCKFRGLGLKNIERDIVGLGYEEELIKSFLDKRSMGLLLPLFWD